MTEKKFNDLLIWISNCLNNVDKIVLDWRVLKKYSDDFLNDNDLEIKLNPIGQND